VQARSIRAAQQHRVRPAAAPAPTTGCSIATGSQADHRRRSPGIDMPNVRTCWTLADARAISRHAPSRAAACCRLGAGFIGCIIMEALAARGVKLTVVRDGRPHGAAHDDGKGRGQ
jgi:pyruvate/2-oxoglutarate dehydrogenase complex dihydrolipoamide dehydrogenase (E3) component